MSRSLIKGPYTNLKFVKLIKLNDRYGRALEIDRYGAKASSSLSKEYGSLSPPLVGRSSDPKSPGFKTNTNFAQSLGPFHCWSRNCVIIPQFIGIIFLIHTGKNFIRIQITEEMVGHKFGEFASTRKKAIFKQKTTKKKS